MATELNHSRGELSLLYLSPDEFNQVGVATESAQS
jgi:hypothetical protein